MLLMLVVLQRLLLLLLAGGDLGDGGQGAGGVLHVQAGVLVLLLGCVVFGRRVVRTDVRQVVIIGSLLLAICEHDVMFV